MNVLPDSGTSHQAPLEFEQQQLQAFSGKEVLTYQAEGEVVTSFPIKNLWVWS